MYWSLHTIYRAPSACFELQQKRLNRQCWSSTETEQLCHTTEGIGSRRVSSDTGSRFIIILGACKLCW